MASFLKTLLGIPDKKVRQRTVTDHKTGKTKTTRHTTLKYGEGHGHTTRKRSESWEEGAFGRKNHQVHSDKSHSGSGGGGNGGGRRKGGRRHKRR